MPTLLPPIPPVNTLGEVVEVLGDIVDWSVDEYAESRLGYFAALYKRFATAVGIAVEHCVFEDGPRMERLGVAFASRYFAALNGNFHAGRFPKPAYSWELTFRAASWPEPIIVQHMLAGLNAHIALDLGVAAQTVAPGAQLQTLRNDFDAANAVLASQVYGVIEGIGSLSPVLADLYTVLMQDEIGLINQALKAFRDSAWKFAVILAAQPNLRHPATIWACDMQVAKQGVLYKPPDLIAAIIGAIAPRESRNVVQNIRVVDEIAKTAAPIRTTM